MNEWWEYRRRSDVKGKFAFMPFDGYLEIVSPTTKYAGAL